jgi:hypothetical protein
MERKYTNYVQVGHNRHEFVLDFGQYRDGDAEPLLHTGIVTSPYYAAAFLEALQHSIRAYRATYGDAASSGPEGEQS